MKRLTVKKAGLTLIVEVEEEERSTERVKSLPVDVLRVAHNPRLEEALELGVTHGR